MGRPKNDKTPALEEVAGSGVDPGADMFGKDSTVPPEAGQTRDRSR
jgi:hypothetical protein